MNTDHLKKLAIDATPGPWAAVISSNMVNRVCAVFETVCETGKNIDDALYIAAANPAIILELIRQRDELLEALKACRKELSAWMRDHGEDIATQEAVAQARAIIAKAEG